MFHQRTFFQTHIEQTNCTKNLETIEKGGVKTHVKNLKTMQSKDSLAFLHKRDICINGNYTIYVPQLDKWYCTRCIQNASDLQKKSERESYPTERLFQAA